MARRLMTLQRQRLAESQVLDRRTRRVLHDDVLPRLHTAMLMLSAIGDDRGSRVEERAGGDGLNPRTSILDPRQSAQSYAEAVGLLGEVHRDISNLLHAMPATAAPELARLGLVGALRQAVDGEFADAFDRVEWQVDPAAEQAAREAPALASEVCFYAAREVVRNAARYGRDGDLSRALNLRIDVAWRNGLELAIHDDGVGMGAATVAAQGGGHGLGLHSTLMAVVGGTLTVASQPGAYTRVLLALPAGALAQA